MRFKFILSLLVATCLINQTAAQEDPLIKELIESIAENVPEDFDLSELQDRFIFYKKHPINLNRTNTETLKTLFLLSPLQINNLFTHIKTHGPLLDLIELQSIPAFDRITIERLSPFVKIDDSGKTNLLTWANLYRLGEHDLVIRLSSVLEKAKGYTELPGTKYLGSREKLLWRYKYNYENRVSAALILEKDAGEKLITNNSPLPFDYQSAHIAIYNYGWFKKIVLGDYALQFGQGLTLWSGFSFGKSPDVASITKKDIGLRPSSSTNEYSFFRGLATTVSLSPTIEFTPFVSFRKLDASLSLNEKGEQVLTNLNETGFHRTATEIDRSQNINQQVFGGVLQYQQANLNLGLIAYHTRLNHSFIKDDALYRAYDFTGNKLSNWGMHYSYGLKNVYLFGEGSHAVNAGWAWLSGALISLSAKVSAAILYRNYSRNYYNFFNQATAEGGVTRNEKGFYAGLNFNPTRTLSFSLYTDYFIFPWLKYRVDAPSKGYEILAQLNYNPSKTFKALLRYRSIQKQQNTAEEVLINYLDLVKREYYRADVNWKLSTLLGFQHRIEVSQFQKGKAKSEFGLLISQDINYSRLLAKLSGNMRLAYFYTPSYDSRLYAYEDDVLYNFGLAMYNGKGWRSYLNLKYKLAKKIDVWLRYALFLYRNADTVGTGLDEIEGNKKTDVKIQMRFQF